jgi:hypothetical protein
MKNQMLLVLLFVSLLTACSPTNNQAPTQTMTSSPTLSPIPTASLTMTPIPMVNLEGTLFFDKNGSGLRDENEPYISNFRVCVKAKDICVSTDDTGRFLFEHLAQIGTNISISFIDPNEGVPSLAYRYINLWKGAINIPTYEINGVLIPEQNLNDTEIIPIESGISMRIGETAYIGLTQGFLTLPFLEPDKGLITCIGWHDHDPKADYFLNFLGTSAHNNGIRCPNMAGYSHNGVDFDVPEGTFIVAPVSGLLTNEFINPDNNARVARLTSSEITNRPNYYLVTLFGHHSTPLVKDIPGDGWNDRTGPKVYRGQIILLSGRTGTYGNPHLHFGYCGNLAPGQTETTEQPGFVCWDPYGIEFDPVSLGYPIDELDKISAWTIYNNPVSP